VVSKTKDSPRVRIARSAYLIAYTL